MYRATVISDTPSIAFTKVFAAIQQPGSVSSDDPVFFQDVEESIYGAHLAISAPIDNVECVERTFGCSVFVLNAALLQQLQEPTVRKVAVFDLDSTLIQMEVIDTLAAANPAIAAEVARITEESMAGRIDFQESLRRRVALLRDMEIEPQWARIRDTVPLTLGAKRLFSALLNDQHGWTTGVISGGFMSIAEHIQHRLGLASAHANELEVDGEGRLTGRLQPGHPVVDAAAKAERLRHIMRECGASLSIAVGDGANDLPMLHEAVLGFAFNAKPLVQQRARFRINHPSLYVLKYILSAM